MASSVEDDLTCPVCLEIYQDPQIVSCGHTFCARCVGHPHTAFSVFYTRTCPLCLQALHQEPVRNLALKNTCESYQREKERKDREEKEKGEEMKCPIHGEKVLFFCVDDGANICSQCRKLRHVSHKVQLLAHTVPQRKDRIKAALRPAEKVMESLRNETALECKVTKCIESQAQHAERQIKEDFEKLHQFLREEEEARRAALREEEEEKKGKLEIWIERELQSISDRLMEVEEDMDNDDVTFLSNYDQIITRARGRLSNSMLNSGSLINMAKHVGNLKFRVWEKMKDLCPYYPVVLDPNSSHISVSSDLVSVSCSVRRFYSPNPLQKKSNYLALGSEAQNAPLNCWDVEVGDSKHWILGVCERSSAERNHLQDLTPQNGFYGLSRKGDFYYVLGSTGARLTLRHPKTVRVKLTKCLNFDNKTPNWLLSFTDASKNSVLVRIPILSFRSDLCPFLVPEERNVPLCIVPVNVNMSMEEKFTFFERHRDKIPLYIIVFFLVVIFILVVPLAMFWKKTDRK